MAVSSELVHRGYSFVCLSCGHGWEAEFAIRLTTDDHGRLHATYYVDERRVPSPLKDARCPACESHHVRILRPGRVESARVRHED
ncbi:hypothetical protein [Streptomyces sp. NPDC001661]